MGNEISSNSSDIPHQQDSETTSTSRRRLRFLRDLQIGSTFSRTMSFRDRNARDLAKKYQDLQSTTQELKDAIQLADTNRRHIKKQLASHIKKIPEINQFAAYRDFMKCFSEHGKCHKLAEAYIDQNEVKQEKLSESLQELNDKNRKLSDKFEEFKLQEL